MDALYRNPFHFRGVLKAKPQEFSTEVLTTPPTSGNWPGRPPDLEKGENEMKRLLLFAAVIALFGVVIQGFASRASSISVETDVGIQEKSLWTMLDQARASHDQLSVIQTKGLIAWQKDLLILDVREPAEFRAGHIPRAVNLPRGLLEFQIASLAQDTSRPILVYCKEGYRGALSGRTLSNLGYTQVSNLVGGWDAWSRYEKQFAEPASRPFWE
jgi:rhodanese-related sulfurtransferase